MHRCRGGLGYIDFASKSDFTSDSTLTRLRAMPGAGQGLQIIYSCKLAFVFVVLGVCSWCFSCF
ncbi:hypothetical protein BDW69DRAFT_162349 [Aspergillus filifer]